MKKIGYARVSTRIQAKNGNSLEDQIIKLKDEGCASIFKETYTGAKTDRPEFNKALAELNEGDTLVITKLDRFARSAIGSMKIVKELKERGVRIHILNMGLVEDTPNGNLIFNIMASFAQFERDMIMERTQEGKAIAKLSPGFKEGRPKVHKKKAIEHAMVLLQSHTYPEVVEMTGISKSTLVRAKRRKEEHDDY